MDVRIGVEAEEVRQAAKHTLFVEGDSEESIDPQVLGVLLKDNPIQIKAMGPSSHIRSAAEALHKHHPYYYFLIDRDHHEQSTVERYWEKFPHSETCNLLIWRRKELENYFLIPEYLLKSRWLKRPFRGRDRIEDFILKVSRKRIFLDAANMVIIGCREEMKKKWIEIFSDVGNFDTKEKALAQLHQRDEFIQKARDVHAQLDVDSLTQRFTTIVVELFGGQDELRFGYGSWLEMVSGKSVLRDVISHCFYVKGRNGKMLQGQDKLMAVVKNLLEQPLEEQPEDFQKLYRLITEQIKKS